MVKSRQVKASALCELLGLNPQDVRSLTVQVEAHTPNIRWNIQGIRFLRNADGHLYKDGDKIAQESFVIGFGEKYGSDDQDEG